MFLLWGLVTMIFLFFLPLLVRWLLLYTSCVHGDVLELNNNNNKKCQDKDFSSNILKRKKKKKKRKEEDSSKTDLKAGGRGRGMQIKKISCYHF
jgi:hypothetical protein